MRIGFVLTALLAVFLCGGCASTRLDGSWRDPGFAGPTFTKVMVVGVTKQADARRLFEDRFAADLRAHGVEGVQSYTLIPEDGQVSEQRIREVVKQSGADAVLVTRLIGSSQRTTSYYDSGPPAYVGGFYGYYGSGAWDGPIYDSTINTYQYNVYTMEIKLFDVAADRLVWAGTTTTEDPISRDSEIKKLARVISDALAEDKLIGGTKKG